MEVKRVVVGRLQTNCYILIKDGVALVIDPGEDAVRIKEAIGDNKLGGVLITHSHFDHVGALREFTKKNTVVNKRSNLEEREYEIGPFKFDVIYTPGHSSDSITFYFKEEGIMFTGDFLFKEEIGRCDLPTGNINEMYNSIDKILGFDKNIIIYPGHDEESTLNHEFLHNDYIKERLG